MQMSEDRRKAKTEPAQLLDSQTSVSRVCRPAASGSGGPTNPQIHQSQIPIRGPGFAKHPLGLGFGTGGFADWPDSPSASD